MGLATELKELSRLIEKGRQSTKCRLERLAQEAREKLEQQRRNFEFPRDQKIGKLKEIQERAIGSFAMVFCCIGCCIGIVASIIMLVEDAGKAFGSSSDPITVIGCLVTAPITIPLALIIGGIIGGVPGYLVGLLVGGVTNGFLSLRIARLKRRVWKPPPSVSKDH